MSRKHDLFHFFTVKKEKSFLLPESTDKPVEYSVMTPEMLDYFFKRKSNTIKSMSKEDLYTVCNAYFFPEYKEVFGRVGQMSQLADRGAPRFPVKILGTMIISGVSRIIKIDVTSASQTGVSLRLQDRRGELPFKQGDKVWVVLNVFKNKKVKFRCRVAWIGEQKLNGLEILSVKESKAWESYVRHLEAPLQVARLVETTKISRTRRRTTAGN